MLALWSDSLVCGNFVVADSPLFWLVDSPSLPVRSTLEFPVTIGSEVDPDAVSALVPVLKSDGAAVLLAAVVLVAVVPDDEPVVEPLPVPVD